MTAQHGPVVIVGAGPVGLACALLLAKRGVATVILERHREPYALPRAVHLDDEVFRILQAVGVDEKFAPHTRAMPGMRLINGRGRVMTEFTRSTEDGANGYPLGSMFDQPDLERVLLDEADSVDLIDLRRGCQVTDIAGGTRPVVCYQNSNGGIDFVDAAAVIGCDGANSLVRDQLGITMRDFHFDERWLVIDVLTQAPLDVWGGVHQICDPDRAATFMPVTGNRYRWEFRVHDGEDLDALRSEQTLQKLLSTWMTPPELADAQIMRQAVYTFRARVAHTWRNGRVFLAGDSAHQTPPFVGQGLGSGLRDAFNLTWKLADVLDGSAPESLLDTYEAERKPHATRIILTALAVGWALTGGQDRLASIRRAAVTAVCHVPRIAHALPDASPSLRHGPMVRRRGIMSRLNGTLFPQPRACTAGGIHRLDNLLGPRYALMTRGPLRNDTAHQLASMGLTHIDVEALACVPSTNPSPSEVMRAHHTYAVLLRPDRVVMASARTEASVEQLLSVYRRARHTHITNVAA